MNKIENKDIQFLYHMTIYNWIVKKIKNKLYQQLSIILKNK